MFGGAEGIFRTDSSTNTAKITNSCLKNVGFGYAKIRHFPARNIGWIFVRILDKSINSTMNR